MDPIEKEIAALAANVKETHDNLNRTFEEFKAKQADALKKGDVDVLVKEQADRMGDAMVKMQEAMDQRIAAVEIANKRTPFGLTIEESQDEFKAAKAFFQHTKSRRGELPAGHRIKESDVDVAAYNAYKETMELYLRKDDRTMGPDQLKALSAGSDPDGGYTVTPEMSARIIERQFESSPIRQLAMVETIGSGALDMLEDPNEFTANWVGELETNANTGTPALGKRQIVAHELEARPRASQTLLDDSNIDIEAWLTNKLSGKFGRAEANAFVLGNGVNKPRGMATYTAGTTWGTVQQVVTGANGGVTYAGLTNIVTALKEAYQGNASWLLRRELIGKVLALSGSDTPLWIPSIAVGQPSTLLGYPVRMAQDFAALATDSLSGAFGDFRQAYTIVDRVGIRIQRDPYTAKPNVEFYTTKRVGGDVVDFDALKIVKLSA